MFIYCQGHQLSDGDKYTWPLCAWIAPFGKSGHTCIYTIIRLHYIAGVLLSFQQLLDSTIFSMMLKKCKAKLVVVFGNTTLYRYTGT